MELKALLIQGDNYRVFTEDERGREKWRNVERFTFFRILEAAGEPGYTEPNYWTYDNRAIQWDDVYAESRGI